MLKSTTRKDGCSRLDWIQLSWTTCENGCLRYKRIALTRQRRNYHVITTKYPTIRARERQWPVPTQCETPRNQPHARNWKITRALLTPCCSLGSLCVCLFSSAVRVVSTWEKKMRGHLVVDFTTSPPLNHMRTIAPIPNTNECNQNVRRECEKK